ncbi:MAG: TolC family protein [Deltaproteobacteria bacterium]|nr:TolC family protein [Deltaproteobacteria bacterium]
MRAPFLLLLTLSLASPAPASAAEVRLTLEEALAEVREKGEGWEIAALRVEESRALRREALSPLLPSLSLGGSGVWNGVTVDIGGSSFRPRYDWDATARLSLTLVDPALYPSYRAAARQTRAAEARAAWIRAELLFEVEQAFFQLAALEEELSIARRAAELRATYVERARALIASELALPIDLARARASQLEAEQLVLDAEGRLGSGADALALLLGRAPDGGLRASFDTTLPPEQPPEAAPEVPPGGRADLRGLKLSLEARRLQIDRRWWSLFPALSLSGQVGLGEPSFTSPDGYSGSITLSLRWTLYDGGATYALLAAERARARIEELELSRATRRAEAEMSRARRDWRLSFAVIGVATEKLEAARQAHEMARARFEAGTADTIEVDEAADALLRAEVDLNRARLRARIARAAYLHQSETGEQSP